MNMITKLIRNIQSSNKGECADVLGSERTLQEIATIWENNAGDFQLIVAYLVTEMATKGDYTKKEMKMYRKALADLMKFLDDSQQNYYNILKD